MSRTEVFLPTATVTRGFFDWALSLVGKLRAGQATTVIVLTTNVFVLLASYYVLKTVREALILSEAGAQVKSYSSAGQALLFLAVIPAYSFLASRVTRSKLITWVTLFFISHLAIFYFLGSAGFHVGVPFFLWVGVFNVLVIAQFWSLANDLNDSESGKRMFPIVGIGSSLGAWVGAHAAGELFRFLNAYELMLAAAAGLLFCTVLAYKADPKTKGKTAAPIGGDNGFRLVLSSRYLLLIAMMVLLVNVVNSLGEYILGQMAVADAQSAVASGLIDSSQMKAAIGKFYGDFFGWVNLVGLLLQIFVVSRLFEYVGVRGALFVLPFIALASYGLMALLPVLGIVKIAKVLENGSDYSIQNTARHALFLPTSREAKYKAKAAIDTFFWRVGDVLQAGVVLLGTHFAFTTRDYAWINIVLVVLWLALILCIYREARTVR